MRGEGCPVCKFGREIPKWRDNETQDEKNINNGNNNNISEQKMSTQEIYIRKRDELIDEMKRLEGDIERYKVEKEIIDDLRRTLDRFIQRYPEGSDERAIAEEIISEIEDKIYSIELTLDDEENQARIRLCNIREELRSIQEKIGGEVK
jgi:hypothetical protein